MVTYVNLLRGSPVGQMNELQPDKTIKMICAPSEDSDQPGH